MILRSVFAAAAASCVTSMLLLAAVHVARADAAGTGTTVRTESGLVSAEPSGGVIAYLGIPFAAPPVGGLRWRAPQPASNWTDVRGAADFGESCPQAQAPRAPAGSRGAQMSEDCLTLNVWTPVMRPSSKALPVMVWIHGGGNDAGSSSDPYTDGGSFARDGVVLVSFNYRLGALGFFAPRAILDEAGAEPTGNFGLLDQIAALRWVRANVAAFGGDPANVTLFGESAGALDAITLAQSPAATGLFSRVIAESAGDLWGAWPPRAKAEELSARVVTSLGLSGDRATASELRALPVEKLASLGGDRQLGLIVDGHVVTQPFRASGLRNVRVPIVIGTNAGDGSLVDGDTNYGGLFPTLSSGDLAFVKARYAARGIETDAAVTSQLFGDGFFVAPSRWVARRVAAAGQRAYLYRFDYVLSALKYRRPAATHGSEIPFVFENYPPLAVTDTDRAAGSALHDCWIAFARTGKPDCAAAGTWPPYDANASDIMVFDEHPSTRPQDDRDVLQRLEERLLAP